VDSILLVAHSLLRWVILLVALVGLVRYSLVWQGRMAGGGMDRGLMAAFTGLLDLQALMGLILILLLGLEMPRIEHAATMIVAVIAAHLGSVRWRNAQEVFRARGYLFVILITLALIVAGVLSLGGAERWTLRF
jgi:hypothetical protein